MFFNKKLTKLEVLNDHLGYLQDELKTFVGDALCDKNKLTAYLAIVKEMEETRKQISTLDITGN